MKNVSFGSFRTFHSCFSLQLDILTLQGNKNTTIFKANPVQRLGLVVLTWNKSVSHKAHSLSVSNFCLRQLLRDSVSAYNKHALLHICNCIRVNVHLLGLNH